MIDNMVQRKVPKRKNAFAVLKFIPVLMVFVVVGVLFFFDYIGIQENYVFIIFLLIVIPISLGVSFLETKNWKNTWRAFAERSGFTYEEYQQALSKWARVKGSYRGHPFMVEKFVRGSGKYKKAYTSIKIALREKPAGALEISAHSLFSGLAKAVYSSKNNLQYVELNDVELDSELVIKSTSEQFARNALSSMGVRQGLTDIRSQTPSMQLKLDGGELYYHELSVIVDGEYLMAVLNFLIELVESAGRYR